MMMIQNLVHTWKLLAAHPLITAAVAVSKHRGLAVNIQSRFTDQAVDPLPPKKRLYSHSEEHRLP